jgi:Lon protease-like protein
MNRELRSASEIVQRREMTAREVDDVDIVAHAGAIACRVVVTEYAQVRQAADRNLVTSLSMVLPFGPAEKEALLEAADTNARAKLLVALLEMAAFGQPPDTPQRAN